MWIKKLIIIIFVFLVTKIMECSICYEAMTKETGKLILSCSHEFHINCLIKWKNICLKNKSDDSCPLCRRASSSPHEVIPENEDSESSFEYVCGYQHEVNYLFRLMGGQGFTDEGWRETIIEQSGLPVVENREREGRELLLCIDPIDFTILMIKNGCKRTLNYSEWANLATEDCWYNVLDT